MSSGLPFPNEVFSCLACSTSCRFTTDAVTQSRLLRAAPRRTTLAMTSFSLSPFSTIPSHSGSMLRFSHFGFWRRLAGVINTRGFIEL